MNELILNDQIISTDRPAGMPLLDFVRYEQHLTGTKIGCREGDCGACTVLVGTLLDGRVHYRSVTSCISPLGNAFGKHVVTIDGLKRDGLSRIQEAIVSEGATQCGFCTPGFVVSLTGYCLSSDSLNDEGAIAAINGNICRCTGYKSIERSALQVVSALEGSRNLDNLIENHFLPEYFRDIPGHLDSLTTKRKETAKRKRSVVGGGTDLYVQRPEELSREPVDLLFDQPDLAGIMIQGERFRVGATTTATDLLESEEMNRYFPNLKRHFKLVSSTQIRNMGTIGGNLVNASPIGDLTIFFLALNATILLRDRKKNTRTVPLNEFYRGYKKLDKRANEIVEALEFPLPGQTSHFNFEKVSKRTHLDIASVNTAIQLSITDNRVEKAHLSAGGIGPVPTYLDKTGEFLSGRPLAPRTVKEAADVVAGEISPISDVRGSAGYKKLLLRQLFFAHFVELFPKQFSLPDLLHEYEKR